MAHFQILEKNINSNAEKKVFATPDELKELYKKIKKHR